MDVVEMRAELAAGLTGLRTFGISTYPLISGAQALPFAAIGTVQPGQYSTDYAGSVVETWPLWVVTSRANEAAAVQVLDRAISTTGDGSVYAAIRALSALEGKPWRSLTCLAHGSYGLGEKFGTVPTLAVEFTIQIRSRKIPEESP